MAHEEAEGMIPSDPREWLGFGFALFMLLMVAFIVTAAFRALL